VSPLGWYCVHYRAHPRRVGPDATCQNGNTQVFSMWRKSELTVRFLVSFTVPLPMLARDPLMLITVHIQLLRDVLRKICGHRNSSRLERRLVCLGCWPLRVFALPRFRRMAGFKPGQNLFRWDCPSRQMGVDGAGGDDQSAFEFGSREIPGFRFGIKRPGQAGISSLYQGATPGYLKRDIPSMIHL